MRRWALGALTILVAACVIEVILVVRASEPGRFGGRDYTNDEGCRHVPRLGRLRAISGFTAVGPGEVAYVARQPLSLPQTPAIIYVFHAGHGCVAQYDLEGGP